MMIRPFVSENTNTKERNLYNLKNISKYIFFHLELFHLHYFDIDIPTIVSISEVFLILQRILLLL